MSSADQGDDVWPCSGRVPIVATGNWYLDAGIVGFLRTLRGWSFEDDDELRGVLNGDVPCERLLFDFSFAFWHSRVEQGEGEGAGMLEDLRKGIRESWKNAASQGYGPDIARSNLVKLVDEYQERAGSPSGESESGGSSGGGDGSPRRIFRSSRFLTNFEFDNPSVKDQRMRIEKFIDYLSAGWRNKDLDRALLKLLPSVEESRNEFLRVLTLRDLVGKVHPLSHAFLISFEMGIVDARGAGYGNLYFHSPDIESSYRIQEELALRLEGAGHGDDLTGTLADALKRLVEAKGQWVLQNLTVVEMGSPNNQRIGRVKYYPFDECAARILTCDRCGEFVLGDFLRRAESIDGLSGLSGLMPLSMYAVEWVREAIYGGGVRKHEFLLSWAAADVVRARGTAGNECCEEFCVQRKRLLRAYRQARTVFGALEDRTAAARRAQQLVDDLLMGDPNIFLNDLLRSLAAARPSIGADALGDYGDLLGHLADVVDYAVGREDQDHGLFVPKVLPVILGAWSSTWREERGPDSGGARASTGALNT
ncbi:MAG: hypothetical protein ACP5ME_12605 [Anaerolineae bacterium]